MDLYAYQVSSDEDVKRYIKRYYGDIPRMRGVRFMKLHKKIYDDDNTQNMRMFHKYCGEDVIYIHTRCGDCGAGFDSEDSNYIHFEADKWEEKHKDLFLDHCIDSSDSTYCDHYFKAVIDDDYKKILKMFKEDEE